MAASRKTGVRKKPAKAGPRTGARAGARTGARAAAGLGWWRSLCRSLAILPLGPTLFLVGVSLGFGAGLGLTMLPPPDAALSAADLPLPIQKPVEKKEPAQKAAATAEPSDMAAVSDASIQRYEEATAVGTVVDPAPEPVLSVMGAVAEEGIHQSAEMEALPPTSMTPPAAVLPASLVTPAPKMPEGLPQWQRNAVSVRDPGDRPMIAIVLDDVGVAPQHAREALALPPPIVLSIMTYADQAAALALEASQLGHEVMVHMPMQPLSGAVNPGPHALTVGLDAEEIRRRMDWGLGRLDGYVGFNNHMGSRFTQDEAGMRVVLELAKARGLLFLDSKTIGSSVGDALAAELGVAHISRDVFLDDDISEVAVARQLAAAEAIARQRGYAVAIGHPHPATIAALKRWLAQASARGFAVVPLTTIVKKRDGVAG